MAFWRKLRRQPRLQLAALASFTVALSLSCSGAIATPWVNGDLTTYPQGRWDVEPSAVQILQNGFLSVYPSSVVEVGIPGPGGYSIRFTDPSFIHDYLPAVGIPAPLIGDLINPTSSSSGDFGADVLSLELNVDFSDAGLMPATQTFAFGDLQLYGIAAFPALNNLSIRDVLALANIALGGGNAGIAVSDMDDIVDDLNGAFALGIVGPFALDHLAAPKLVISEVPEPSSMLMLLPGILALALAARFRRERSGRD